MDENLLILDLDETLLYASERPLDRDPDLVVSAYLVCFRPGLAEKRSWRASSAPRTYGLTDEP